MCLHEDACTDYNDEPGTDLELAKVIIRKCALHATIKNCTTYLSNKSVKIKPAPGESPQSTNLPCNQGSPSKFLSTAFGSVPGGPPISVECVWWRC